MEVLCGWGGYNDWAARYGKGGKWVGRWIIHIGFHLPAMLIAPFLGYTHLYADNQGKPIKTGNVTQHL